MNNVKNCPFCQGFFEIKKLKCQSCETEITGSFGMNRFQQFDDAELYFIEVFLKAEGNIKTVEKKMGISYPTVKNKLSLILTKLGYRKTVPTAPSDKMELLEKLSKGETLLAEATPRKTSTDKDQNKKFIRIKIQDGGENHVDINLPLALAKVGLKLASKDKFEALTKNGINIEDIIKMVEDGAQGELVNIRSNENGKDTRVKIYID